MASITTNKTNASKFTGYAGEGLFGCILNLGAHIDIGEQRIELDHPLSPKDVKKVLSIMAKHTMMPMDSFESNKDVISLADF